MLDYTYSKGKVQRQQDVIDLIFELTGGEGFIAGGFARYCTSPLDEPIVPSDIDVFCENDETYERILKRFKKNPKTNHRSNTAIETKYEFSITTGYHRNGYIIQLIKPVNIKNMVADGDYKRVLDNFDFTIAKCAILSDGTVWVHNDFSEHEETKQLVITNIHCPISSMKRVIKYTKRGYEVSSEELLKLFNDYQNRSDDWKDLIRRGLADEIEDQGEKQRFVETMYLD